MMIIDTSLLGLFFLAAITLLLTPGPAVFYIVTRSIDQGRKAGIVSVLGIATGSLFHVAAAALGLSAILVASAMAFNAVRFIGAAYLIFLGLRKLFSAEPVMTATVTRERNLLQTYRQGVVVNVLNPKNALFFLAFMPQFVNVSKGHVGEQFLILGLMFTLLGLLSDGSWALMASSLGSRLRTSTRFLRFQRYFAGTAYLTLGAAAAFSGSGRKH